MVARKASSVHNTWGVKHGNVFIANKQCLAYVWILSYWRISKQLDECAALVLWPRHKSWSIIIDNWQYGDFRSPNRTIKLAKVTLLCLSVSWYTKHISIFNKRIIQSRKIAFYSHAVINSFLIHEKQFYHTYVLETANAYLSSENLAFRPTLHGFTAANILCSHCAILAVFGFWNVGGSTLHNPMNA